MQTIRIGTKQQDTFPTVVSPNQTQVLMSFQSNLRKIPYLQTASHKKMFLMNEFWFYSGSLDSRDMCSRTTPKEKGNRRSRTREPRRIFHWLQKPMDIISYMEQLLRQALFALTLQPI